MKLIFHSHFSDTVSADVREKYGAQIKGIYGIGSREPEWSRENVKKMQCLEGETVIRPGTHFAFSPNAHNIAYISVRTAHEAIA